MIMDFRNTTHTDGICKKRHLVVILMSIQIGDGVNQVLDMDVIVADSVIQLEVMGIGVLMQVTMIEGAMTQKVKVSRIRVTQVSVIRIVIHTIGKEYHIGDRIVMCRGCRVMIHIVTGATMIMEVIFRLRDMGILVMEVPS
jgi:uncharacterized membrane protein YciS (DUF1049 family)